MFGAASVVLVFSLLSFGAVSSHHLLALTIAAAIAVTVAFARRSASGVAGWFDFALVIGGIGLGVWRAQFGLTVLMLALAYMADTEGGHKTIRFLKFLVIVGVLESLLSLTQFFVSPGWIFGYQGVYRSSGTLVNSNHFAGLLEMLIPAAIGLSYVSSRKHDLARSYIFMLAAALMGLAVIFSLSRMGTVSFAATLIFLFLTIRAQTSQRLLAGAIIGITLSFVVLTALWAGIDTIVQRYELLLDEELQISDVRFTTFRDTIKMIGVHPAGIGVGNYRDIFRQYQTERQDLLFDHAHNDYLETIAEWGIAIALLFWGTLIALLVWVTRSFGRIDSVERRGVLLACAGAMFAILFHSSADFNLQIPSNAMLFFVYLGIALRQVKSAKNSVPARF